MLRRLAVAGRAARAPARGLEEFFDGSATAAKSSFRTGRSWRAAELRLKSFDELHKLWYVLLKEKNMLMSEKALAKRLQMTMANPERLGKVKKSMARLKTVLSERSRVHKLEIQAHTLREEIAASLAEERRAAEVEALLDKARSELDIERLVREHYVKLNEERVAAAAKHREEIHAKYAESLTQNLVSYEGITEEELNIYPRGHKVKNEPVVVKLRRGRK